MWGRGLCIGGREGGWWRRDEVEKSEVFSQDVIKGVVAISFS
jgi:hypothetical protein